MPREQAPTNRLSPRKIAVNVVLAVGAVVIACLVAFLLFTDTFVNELLKGRNISNFEKTHPNYSLRIRGVGYDIWQNRLKCDSLSLTPTDSGFSCTIAASSVSGIGWIPLFLGRALTPEHLANSDVDADNFVLIFPREQYQLRCGRLHVSVGDSAIVADSFELRPIAEDEQFFAANKFRRTRYRLVIPHWSMTGSACIGFLRRDMFCGRSARLQDPVLDILANKDKPKRSDSSNPLMPHEVFATIKATLQLDSLSITNGRLTYGERFARGADPAEITLDSMRVTVGGIANRCCDHDSTVLMAQGRFMNAGAVNVRMAIPVATPDFSLRYSGTLSRMPLKPLNSFLEVAEQIRIKSGDLHSATFDINVKSGQANGAVRIVYSDLSIAMLNEETGSEKGIVDRLTSFVANTIKIRQNNLPDKSGAVKLGEVAYKQKSGDSFFRFLWYALRSGLGDVMGF